MLIHNCFPKNQLFSRHCTTDVIKQGLAEKNIFISNSEIAPTNKNNGLNDNGDDVDIKSIENKVNMFCEEISTQKYSQNTDYQKLIKQIEKYKAKLFADPIAVINSNGEEIVIQPQRTNNLLEQFFRGLKRDYIKRSGNSKLSKALQSMIADTPLIKNLDNQNYRTILLNGYNTLEERFAEIDEKNS